MRRRDFVTAASALAIGTVAGCIAEGNGNLPGGDTPTDETDTDDPASSQSESPPPSEGDVQSNVLDHRIETVETSCMSQDSTGIDVSFEEAAVAIAGIAQTPTPCYEARIDSAAVSEGELRVEVAFEKAEGVCVECVGALAYEATVDVDTTDGIDTATVTHGDGETRFTENRGGDDPSPSPGDGPARTPSGDPSSDPDPDLPISLDNEHDERHEIEVEIKRESGETVYAETHVIDADTEREIYNLREASPEGVEPFSITATMDGTTESIRVETSTCYGQVFISVTEDGMLYPYYSIC